MTEQFKSDGEALRILQENGVVMRIVIIYLRRPPCIPSKNVLDAVDYLVDEWDYELKWV